MMPVKFLVMIVKFWFFLRYLITTVLIFAGWVHYMTHDPEPHILLFRRPTAIYGANQNQNQAPNQQN